MDQLCLIHLHAVSLVALILQTLHTHPRANKCFKASGQALDKCSGNTPGWLSALIFLGPRRQVRHPGPRRAPSAAGSMSSSSAFANFARTVSRALDGPASSFGLGDVAAAAAAAATGVLCGRRVAADFLAGGADLEADGRPRFRGDVAALPVARAWPSMNLPTASQNSGVAGRSKRHGCLERVRDSEGQRGKVQLRLQMHMHRQQ